MYTERGIRWWKYVRIYALDFIYEIVIGRIFICLCERLFDDNLRSVIYILDDFKLFQFVVKRFTL